MKRRERSESFYIPSERIEKYKKEFTPLNREITTIEEGNEDEDIEIGIKREELNPEIAMLAHLVDEELISRRNHNADEKASEKFQEEFINFDRFGDMNLQDDQINGAGSEEAEIVDGMNLQVDQINGTRSEDTVIRASMEFAGVSCSSSSPVIDSK